MKTAKRANSANGRNLQNSLKPSEPVNIYKENRKSTVSAKARKQPSLYSLEDTGTSLSLPRKQPSLRRKFRYRNVEGLKPWQVEELHAAEKYTEKIGLPLNRFITITWLLTEHGKLCAEKFQHGMKNMYQWFRYKGVETAWLYVHENPKSPLDDDKPNTHIMLHLPRKINRSQFAAMLEKWFGALDGGIKSEPRTRSGYQGQDTRLQYMTKGADFLTCRRHGGHRSKGGQGTVPFKRSGTSQNIGLKARLEYDKT